MKKKAFWVVVVGGIVFTATGFRSSSETELDLIKIQYARLSQDLSDLKTRLAELKTASVESSRAGVVNPVINGRLTLESGVAVSSSDQTNASTLYFTPYYGNKLTLYNGTNWQVHTFSQVSLSLSGLTSGLNYDVFIYKASVTSAPTLELVAWSSDTARATGLATQNGVYVKSGATSRRYVGTIRTTGTTTTTDSVLQRYVWNYYNRERRLLQVVDTTDTWAGAAWRKARNSTANKVEYVVGINEVLVEAHARAAGSGGAYQPGVGLSSETNAALTVAASNIAGTYHATYAAYLGYPGLGYQYLYWLENNNGVTAVGDNGLVRIQNGMMAYIQG